MTTVVLDASAALSWLLPTQATEASDAALLRLAEFAFVAPFVFDWEVQNILLAAGRSSPAFHWDLLIRLDALEVVLENPLPVHRVLAVAADKRLSLFDAAYLHLALEQGLPLMSRDGRLVETAAASGVEVRDLR